MWADTTMEVTAMVFFPRSNWKFPIDQRKTDKQKPLASTQFFSGLIKTYYPKARKLISMEIAANTPANSNWFKNLEIYLDMVGLEKQEATAFPKTNNSSFSATPVSPRFKFILLSSE